MMQKVRESKEYYLFLLVAANLKRHYEDVGLSKETTWTTCQLGVELFVRHGPLVFSHQSIFQANNAWICFFFFYSHNSGCLCWCWLLHVAEFKIPTTYDELGGLIDVARAMLQIKNIINNTVSWVKTMKARAEREQFESGKVQVSICLQEFGTPSNCTNKKSKSTNLLGMVKFDLVLNVIAHQGLNCLNEGRGVRVRTVLLYPTCKSLEALNAEINAGLQQNLWGSHSFHFSSLFHL
ncbi:hypothetical protein G9A89_017368 [Geosiphon pyriformis]|nr:hypothetical protein G9A89_017368 [Geosiphon pyriformis]